MATREKVKIKDILLYIFIWLATMGLMYLVVIKFKHFLP